VLGLAFNPEGTRLATACGDHTIRLWDVATGKEVCELRGHEAYVHAVAFSPDGTRLASASGDSTVRIWDTVPQFMRTHPPADRRPPRNDVTRANRVSAIECFRFAAAKPRRKCSTPRNRWTSSSVAR
jgi:WD40 repeat protein